tara:strand:+ start:126 stop:599 length:474 start_codon:yes stop_codon:yes gene_type:complete
MLKQIKYGNAYPLWKMLWPGRDDIKPMSSMTDLHDWDMNIYEKYEPIFFGIYTDDTNELVAVNSCHPTSETRMRSRGLYVKSEYTGNGLAQGLLQHTIDYSRNEGYEVLWSIPRLTALKSYTSVGFIETGDRWSGEAWKSDGVPQTQTNAYAEIKLK